MGCSNSKLDNEEVVLFCKERRRFIKQAVEHRYELASAHVAYIHALKNVGIALRHIVEQDETLMDSSNPTSPGTTIFTPPAATTPESGDSMPKKSPSPTTESPVAPDSSSTPVVNCLKSGTTSSVFFQESPPSPESVRIGTYSPANQFGMDGFFGTHMRSMPTSPPMASSYNNQDFLSPLPSLPQDSTWDFFNPFSSLSLDSLYTYNGQRRLSQVFDEDDIREMNRVREEEGIPDLEEEDQQKSKNEGERNEIQVEEKLAKTANVASVESSQEQPVDYKSAVESISDALTQAPNEPSVESVAEASAQTVVEEIPSKSAQEGGVEEVKEKPAVEEEVKDKEIILEKANISPVVTNRPVNMLQVIKNIEEQFIRAYEAGKDVSALLEASKVHPTSGLGDIKEHSAKVLNSIALFRSSSSRSSSFRTNPTSSSSIDNLDDSSSDFAEDCIMISGSHASTLDRIYAWEKKLYDEVKAGERLRITYDKKCALLRHQDAKGEDHQLVDKTRAAIKSLHTGIKVSIQAIDSVSKRIHKLRDEELQPQLVELIQGWMQMWQVMLDCHQIQYRLSSSISGGVPSVSNRQATIELEHELHGWHTSFSNWINSQKSYVEALNGWLSKCIIPETGPSSKGRIPFSPRRVGAPLVFSTCRDWCRAFEQICDKAVVAAIRNFALDVRALWEQQDEEQRQKRRAEYVAKDLDRRVVTLQRVESRRQDRDGMGPTDTGIAERKMSIDSFRKRVEEEKARHQKVLKETQNATLNVLQTGLTLTFEALTAFATASLKTYKELHESSQKAKI